MTDRRAWHFLRADGKLRDGGEPPADGEWLVHGDECVMCESGLHASRDIMGALSYAPGPVLCRVECADVVEEDADKLVCRRRRIVWRVDATQILRRFAAACARRALTRERRAGRKPDPRSWAAVDAAEAYADGRISDEDLIAAQNAAWSAADAARSAARSAAWSAARSAARNAADAAARSAAWIAADAARSAARSAAWSAAPDAARNAADAAARSAAWIAAWSAADAARSAAWSAARDAARNAASAARDAARNAARDRERSWQRRTLLRMVREARRSAGGRVHD